jgi:uncharacterized membrane protein YfcA
MMEFLHGIQPLYSVCGFFVGALVGVTGMGGGSLMTPILILLFGVTPTVAVGTDLLYAAITKTGGSLIHGLARNIDWGIVGRLAAGSVPAACLTLFVLAHVDKGGSSKVVTQVLAFALLATAIALFFREQLIRTRVDAEDGPEPQSCSGGLTIAVGVVLGVLVPISSVGAGALGVTALIFLYPRVPLIRIVGSDIAHAVPLTLVGGIGHMAMGGVNVPILVSLLIGSLPGIALGSYGAGYLPQKVLRFTLATVLALIAIKLILA